MGGPHYSTSNHAFWPEQNLLHAISRTFSLTYGSWSLRHMTEKTGVWAESLASILQQNVFSLSIITVVQKRNKPVSKLQG